MRFFLASFTLFVCLLAIFLPLKWILVKDGSGRQISFFLAKDGDRIEISHINSIYDANVREILRVVGEELEVISVETESHGVKEYYGISDGFSPRRFRAVTFFNSRERGFRLKVKGEEVDLKGVLDERVTVSVDKATPLGILSSFF